MSYDPERPLGASEPTELERSLAYLRDGHLAEDLILGSVCGMEIGDSGWTAYWVMETDTAGRHWLNPLFRLSNTPHRQGCAFITRDADGYKIDFTKYPPPPGELESRLYEYIESAEEIDRRQAETPSYIPVAQVIGAPDIGEYRPLFPGVH